MQVKVLPTAPCPILLWEMDSHLTSTGHLVGVQHLTVHNISAQSMLLAWQSVGGATGYRLSWATLTGRCLSQSLCPFCLWPL